MQTSHPTPGTTVHRILDLFCGAGGGAMGWHRAFPHAEITGVDHAPQPNYPFVMVVDDATTHPLDGYDLIHASPPCQDHTSMKSMHSGHGTGWMLAHTLDRLRDSSAWWVVENVPGATVRAAMGDHITLCGSSFGLGVRRHRLFASNFPIRQPQCRHAEQGKPLGVYGTGGASRTGRHNKGTLDEARAAMGIDWMTRAELAQAIPPRYTHYIGVQLADHLARASEVAA